MAGKTAFVPSNTDFKKNIDILSKRHVPYRENFSLSSVFSRLSVECV